MPPFESLYSNLYLENTEHKIKVLLFVTSRIARELQKEPMVEKFITPFFYIFPVEGNIFFIIYKPKPNRN